MPSSVECTWIGKMLIYNMHNLIDYVWTSKNEFILQMTSQT